MKTTCRTFLIFLISSFFQVYISNGQNTELIGLVDNKLVKIDSITGAIQVHTTINKMGSGNHSDLSYHTQNDAYYTILDAYGTP